MRRLRRREDDVTDLERFALPRSLHLSFGSLRLLLPNLVVFGVSRERNGWLHHRRLRSLKRLEGVRLRVAGGRVRGAEAALVRYVDLNWFAVLEWFE